MRSTTIFVAALAVVAGRVAAQDATTTDTADGADSTGIPTCALTCGQQSVASSGCASVYDLSPSPLTDIDCLCASDPFIEAVTDCITTNCSEEDQAAAADFQDQFCADASDPTESISASASSAIASITSSVRAAASSAAASATSAGRSSVSQSVHSVVSSASASATHSNSATTAAKMPSVPFMALGATALAFVVGPLFLFA
ncbi:hypothetical protein FRB90_007278 [Tulasnella sp. 427]|nr:hypothetical protein FRB90_007278 [Tulasnella sp. 427]